MGNCHFWTRAIHRAHRFGELRNLQVLVGNGYTRRAGSEGSSQWKHWGLSFLDYRRGLWYKK